MEFNMEFVATIAVVASVPAFAYQARELARQSRVGNEVAGTQAHREIMLLYYKRFTDVFIQYPELHAYYYDKTPNTPSAADSVRLKVIAEQHGDWLDSCLHTTRQLKSYDWVALYGGWDDYIARQRGVLVDPSVDHPRHRLVAISRPVRFPLRRIAEGSSERSQQLTSVLSLPRPPLTPPTRNHRTPAASTPGRTRAARREGSLGSSRCRAAGWGQACHYRDHLSKEATMADYAATVAPHVYKVLFENEHVRLLEVKMQPGAHTEMHSHPGNLVYILSDGKVTFTDPSGEKAEFEVSPGASLWMEATDHETDNVGDTTVRALMFEPK